MVQTRTEPAGAGFCLNRYIRNGPKTEPLLTLDENDKEDENEDEMIGQDAMVNTSADHVGTMVDDSPSVLPK